MPRVVNMHSEVDQVKQLFTQSPALLHMLDLLFGYKASIYTSLAFEYGTEQPLHRDSPVFRTEPEEFYFGVWVALEDATLDNGCLMALRGGHRGGKVDPFEFAGSKLDSLSEIEAGGSPLWPEYQEAVVELCKKEGAKLEFITANIGDVIVWHPQLPHGGSPIRDAEMSRQSVVFHDVPRGTPVY
jgi:phytanoyl-CoA hydroxylase